MNDSDINNESFNIKPELKVSKIINDHSDKIYTNKNMLDPYDFDINCFCKSNNKHVGFIEVEVSNHKKLDGLKWNHSFLKRKIYEWDNKQYCYTTILRKYYEQTIYIKFNNDLGLTDCICCDINTIKNFKEVLIDKTKSDRMNWTFRTSKFDKRVPVGIGKCIEYIEQKFINFDKLDSWM